MRGMHGVMVELGDRDCVEDHVMCWWVIYELLTLGTDWGLGVVTGRVGMVHFYVCMGCRCGQ